jgi:5'-methylthioadenosine phosphorylase
MRRQITAQGESRHTGVVSEISGQRLTSAMRTTRLARNFPREHEPCPIGSDRALDSSLITTPEARGPELVKKLDAVAGRVLGR